LFPKALGVELNTHPRQRNGGHACGRLSLYLKRATG